MTSTLRWTLVLTIALVAGCGDDDGGPSGGDDAGMSGSDSGTPGTDSGTPGTDSGTPGTDAGTPGTDSGTPGADGGPVTPDAGPPPTCGGFGGFMCPPGLTCIDDPSDECDPMMGGADCPGICVSR